MLSDAMFCCLIKTSKWANTKQQKQTPCRTKTKQASRCKNKPFICLLCLKPDPAQLDTFAVFLCFCRGSSLSVSSCPTPILTTLFLRYSQRWFVFSPFIKQPGLSALSCLLSEMLPLTFHGSFSIFPFKNSTQILPESLSPARRMPWNLFCNEYLGAHSHPL